MDATDPYTRGMTVRREVLGDDHVDRAEAGRNPFTTDFQDFITRYAWGSVWARPGLDRRTRSCITLAVLASLRCDEELAMHVKAAQRNGLSSSDIAEVLLHTAVYAGVPAVHRALRSRAKRCAPTRPRLPNGSTRVRIRERQPNRACERPNIG
jgi:4-carboxymuconolactone decarboxylase